MAIPDWLFYLLSLLLSAALIVFSLNYWPGQSRGDSPFNAAPEEGFVLTGRQLGLMQAAQGLTAELIEQDGVVFLRTASGQAPEDGERSAGVFLTLPKRFSKAYANTTVEVTMILRSAGRTPSPEAMIAYYSPGRGNSQRTQCVLSTQWQSCTMLHKPPMIVENSDVDFVGIWPDLAGLSRTADIKKVQIKPYSGLRDSVSE